MLVTIDNSKFALEYIKEILILMELRSFAGMA